MTEDATALLILVPTPDEAAGMGIDPPNPPGRAVTIRPGVVAGLVGFGPAAAGVWAARHISRCRPNAVLLAGIGGSLDERRAATGQVCQVREVVSFGIGAGEGAAFRTAEALGFSQAPDASGEIAVLHLRADVGGDVTGAAVSVPAASRGDEQVERVRRAHPDAVVEDCETWAVALAARAAGVPLTVVRAISNMAGDGDRARWRIDQATAALRGPLQRAIAAATPEQ